MAPSKRRGRSGGVIGAGAAASMTLCSVLMSCSGEENIYRYDEPLRVRGAQFFLGQLPGVAPLPPLGEGASPPPLPLPGEPPVVTAITVQNSVVYSGEGGKAFGGRASGNASSVAIRLQGLGSGYWVVPLGSADPQYPGEFTWGAAIDFNPSVPSGNQALRVVAIGDNGLAGPASEQGLCFTSAVPGQPGSGFVGDLSACVATRNPPAAVFSLTWTSDVDLDLHVITPEGRDVNPKQPLVDPVDAGEQPARNAARIDRDSLAACVPDGYRREDLVFATRPTGNFIVYANLFNACGKPSVTFTATVYQPVGTPGVDQHLVQTYQQGGRLTAADALGSGNGLFLFTYPF